MPKPKQVDRPIEKTLSLPTSVVTRVELELYSSLEGKVPHGAWSKLVTQLLREHFARIDAANGRVQDPV